MAEAIEERDISFSATQVEILNSRAGIDTPPGPNGSENFLLFDWVALSRSLGTADDAGEVLASLVNERISRIPTGEQIDIHFIGYSRGGYVISEAIRRIGDSPRVGFLQMTTLDPQSQGSDGLLEVAPYVDFADNYWQWNRIFLGGEIGFGAYDVNLDSVLESWQGTSNDHTEVPHWYFWTIDTESTGGYEGILPADREILFPNPEWNEGRTVGFHWSLGGRYAPGLTSGFNLTALRTASRPWQIVGQTLVVAGSDTPDSSEKIHFEDDSGTLLLRIANDRINKEFVISPSSFSKVYIDAGAGDDLIDLRALPFGKPVTALGGRGNDIILGSPSADLLRGGDGFDWIEGGIRENQAANDWITGDAGNDVLFTDTSARRSLGLDSTASREFAFGGSGDDDIYSFTMDLVTGGTGSDNLWGRQGQEADSPFVQWVSPDGKFDPKTIQIGLAGRVFLVGDNLANTFTVTAVAGGFTFTVDSISTFFVASFTLGPGAPLNRVLILPGAGNDTVTMRVSPVFVYIDGGSGNDTFHGSNFDDLLRGGSGDDVMYGYGGNDRMGGKRGNDTLRGGPGHDFLYGDEGTDQLLEGEDGDDILVNRTDAVVSASSVGGTLRGGRGNDLLVPGSGDQTPDLSGDDRLISPSSPAPRIDENLVASSYLVAVAGYSTDVASPQQPLERLSTLPIEISEFTVNPRVITQGDGALFTVRAAGTGHWARLELAVDQNGNGRYDSGLDSILGKFRGRSRDWRGQISTRDFPLGNIAVFARLLSYDGSITDWALTTVAVQGQVSPPDLPPSIPVPPDPVLTILPSRNGDATVRGNELAGRGQIDFWEVTFRNTPGGGARFWTEGTTDTVVAVYDSAGNLIAGPDDDNGPGTNGEILFTPHADVTYYFAVTGKAGATGRYDLRMTGPHQSITDTIDTPPGAYAGSASDSITTAQRLDYFELFSPVGSTLLNVSVDVSPGLDVWVRVADEAGNVIGLAEPGRTSLDQFLTSLHVAGATRYYITVYGLYGTSGTYTVSADFDPDQLGLPDSITRPASGQFASLIPHVDGDYVLVDQSIDAAGQFRYYLFSPTSAGEFQILATGTTDTQLGLYDGPGGRRLAWSDNDADGMNGLVRWQFEAGTDYWVVARAADDTTGTFGIQVIGPDQQRRTLSAAGLAYRAEHFHSIYHNQRQFYYAVTAPSSVFSLDVTLTPRTLAGDDLDAWISIEDEAGNVFVRDAAGPLGVESFSNFAVVGGQTYWITVHGKDMTTGGARLEVDFDPDFSGSGEIPVTTSTFDDQDSADTAMNAAGNSILVWVGRGLGADDDDIFGQRFNSLGQAVGGEFLINAADGYIDQYGPSVAMDTSGNFVVTWVARNNEVEPNTYTTYVRRFYTDGTPMGVEVAVDFPGMSTFMQSPSVAMLAGGSFMVVGGRGFNEVYGRIYTASGVPLGSPIAIDTSSGEKSDPAVVADGAGHFVVAWSAESASRFGVYARRYDASGNPVATGTHGTVRFLVAPGLAVHQWTPAIAANTSGQFAVALEASDTDGTGRNVYVRRFAADGTPLGDPIRPHNLVAGDQERVDLGLKDNGEIVVTWSGPGADQSEIYARHLDAAGNLVGTDEIRINDTTASQQRWPAISTDGQERFGFAWQSFGQDGSGEGVFGRFLNFATPTPTPSLSISETSGTPNDNRLDFGVVAYNTANPRLTVRIANSGTANLAGSLAITGPGAAAYSIAGQATFDLAPGAYADIPIELAAVVRGNHLASLEIQHNGSTSPGVVDLMGTVVPTPDARESNDMSATATDLGSVALTSINNLTLHNTNDEDWLTFIPSSSGLMAVDVAFSHSEGDIDFILFDHNFGIVAAGTSIDDNESAVAQVEAGRRYYLRVYGPGENANVYSVSLADITAPAVGVVAIAPDPRNVGTGTIAITFGEPVSGFDLSDLRLTRDGGSNLLTGTQTLTTADNVTWSLGNLAGLTAIQGVYLLTLTAAGSGITDLAGNALADTASESFSVDTTAPTADVVDVTPDPRTDAVPDIVIMFGEPVSGFDLSDLRLTRDGGSNLLTGTQTLTTADNVTWSLGNLAGLTAIQGRYVLTLVSGGSGIVDAAGNVVSGDASDEWSFASDLLSVSSFIATSSGFTIRFNSPFDPGVLNLYDTATAGFGTADVTVVGSATGPVRGSLVGGTGIQSVTFIRTGGVLPPDTYTVTLRGATDGFKGIDGNPLDGDDDGTAGGDYTATFTVALTSARVLSLPDIARGPGQALDPPAGSAGLPVTLDDGEAITEVSFELRFDPALLEVSDIIRGADAAPGSVAFTRLGPGHVAASYAGAALGAGPREVFRILAAVRVDAPAGSRQVLDLEAVALNGGAVSAVGDDAVHAVSYLGDVDGNGRYTPNDAFLLFQASQRRLGGFAAFPVVDPNLLGDVDGSGSVSPNDAFLLFQLAQGRPGTLPPIPTSMTGNSVGGPAPQAADGDASLALEKKGIVAFEQTALTREDVERASVRLVTSHDPSAFGVVHAQSGALLRVADHDDVRTNDASGVAYIRAAMSPRNMHFGTRGALGNLQGGADSLDATMLDLLGDTSLRIGVRTALTPISVPVESSDIAVDGRLTAVRSPLADLRLSLIGLTSAGGAIANDQDLLIDMLLRDSSPDDALLLDQVARVRVLQSGVADAGDPGDSTEDDGEDGIWLSQAMRRLLSPARRASWPLQAE